MNYFAAFLGLLSVFNASVFGPFTVLRSWSKGVLSTLREGNEGLDEMERFANRVKVGWGDVGHVGNVGTKMEILYMGL